MTKFDLDELERLRNKAIETIPFEAAIKATAEYNNALKYNAAELIRLARVGKQAGAELERLRLENETIKIRMGDLWRHLVVLEQEAASASDLAKQKVQKEMAALRARIAGQQGKS